MIRFLILTGAMALAAPVTAETPTRCWDKGVAPGVFDWPATPSITCRDGTAPSGTSAVQAGPSAETTRPAGGRTPSLTDDIRLTFGGEVYIGVGRVFPAP